MTNLTERDRRTPMWVFALIAVSFAVLLASNAHFVYVAIESDPGCVEHQRSAGTEPGEYRAARSHCSVKED